MNKEHSAPSQGARGAFGWLLALLMGAGFLADLALIVLLLGVGGPVIEGNSSAETGTITAWAIALAVSIIAPIFGLRQWKRGRKDLAIAGVWLPILGLLAGAVFAI